MILPPNFSEVNEFLEYLHGLGNFFLKIFLRTREGVFWGWVYLGLTLVHLCVYACTHESIHLVMSDTVGCRMRACNAFWLVLDCELGLPDLRSGASASVTR